MPETHRYPEKNILIKNDLKEFKANVHLYQKTDVLLTRIQVLENENAESTRLLEKERRSSLERSQFISTASHDCRSPLTSIQLSASLIERYSHRLDRQKLFCPY